MPFPRMRMILALPRKEDCWRTLEIQVMRGWGPSQHNLSLFNQEELILWQWGRDQQLRWFCYSVLPAAQSFSSMCQTVSRGLWQQALLRELQIQRRGSRYSNPNFALLSVLFFEKYYATGIWTLTEKRCSERPEPQTWRTSIPFFSGPWRG